MKDVEYSVEEHGHRVIAQAVASCAPPVVVIEMLRQFGDVLHSTLVVRHLRRTRPGVSIVWAIHHRYADEFGAFDLKELGPHAIARLPDAPEFPKDGPLRVAWVNRAKTLPGVVQAFGCGVHPWGWKAGHILDAVLLNAGISAPLSVPRRPWLPLTAEDAQWAETFTQAHGLKKFVALEYNSYSLEVSPLSWFADLVKQIDLPVVSFAGKNEPLLAGTVDGRGTSFRHTKMLISRASCFVGVGSGLSVLAASHGCEQPVVELAPQQLSMAHLGYRRNRYQNLYGSTVRAVADAVRGVSVGSPEIQVERYKRYKRKRTPK